MNRREFIEGAAIGFGTAAVIDNFAGTVLASMSAAAQSRNSTSALDAARDEDFWREVKGAFSTSRTLINLDNGNICPSPRAVTESMVRYKWMEEEAPAYMIQNVLAPWTTNVFNGLAAQFGCSPEEIAVVRNATEALQTVLLGIELKPGDEVLTTTHDYFTAQQALDQRAMREGIVREKGPGPGTRQIDGPVSGNFRAQNHSQDTSDPGFSCRESDRAILSGQANSPLPTPFSNRVTWTATTLAPACINGSLRRLELACCT